MIAKITQPTLIVNEAICRENIQKMAAKAKRNGVLFRPHFKTHQSSSIGEWFRDEGVRAITVSSVKMAENFAKNGWKDITIAFPANILEIHAIDQLAAEIKLTLLVDQIETVNYLNDQLSNNVGLMIKIDTGYNRAGINATNFKLIQQLIESISEGSKTNFAGFLAHAGHSYNCRNINEIEEVHIESKNKLQELKDMFVNQYPGLIISVGDTPTCSTMEDFSWADEIRPGNFVFYDLSQVSIGSCKIEDIAVVLACPVVSIYKEQNKFIIYGGGVHFSKEVHPEKTDNFGRLISLNKGNWEIIEPGVQLKKLSQEHGIITASKSFIEQINIGDLVYILPIHSCMTANLIDNFLTTNGTKLHKA